MLQTQDFTQAEIKIRYEAFVYNDNHQITHRMVFDKLKDARDFIQDKMKLKKTEA